MAGIFAIFSLALISVILKNRKMAMGLIGFGLLMSILLLWYVATKTLQINW